MLTTKAFLAKLGNGVQFKAAASRKDGVQTRTFTLRGRPDDMTDDAYLHAARVDGIDGAIREKLDDDRTKSASGKEIYGADAQAIACDVLGIPEPVEKPKPKPKERKGEEPSVNGTAPTAPAGTAS